MHGLPRWRAGGDRLDGQERDLRLRGLPSERALAGDPADAANPRSGGDAAVGESVGCEIEVGNITEATDVYPKVSTQVLIHASFLPPRRGGAEKTGEEPQKNAKTRRRETADFTDCADLKYRFFPHLRNLRNLRFLFVLLRVFVTSW